MYTSPSKISFAKAEGDLLKVLYSVNLKRFSWLNLKEKVFAEFLKIAAASHTSLAIINCKQRKANAFIYAWGELLLQCCSMTAEQYRNKLKLTYCNPNLLNESNACRVI